MPSTATTRNGLELQAPGENNNSWGDKLNDNMFSLIDEALDGVEGFTLSGSKTLTSTNYASNEARNRVLNITGGTGGTITIPAVEKVYLVRNNSSGNVVITTGGGANATVTPANTQWVFTTGSDVFTQNIANFGAENFSTTGYAQASNFRDVSDSQNCQLGNGGSDGRSITAGYPGSSYPAIGYNVRFSNGSSNDLIAPRADSACLIQLAGNKIDIHTWATGSAGRTITIGATSLVASIASDGTLLAEGTYNNTTAGSGNVVVTSDGQLRRSSSSAKYKTNIQDLPLEECIRIIKALRVVSYTSTSPGDDPNRPVIGLIAEEVFDICPALVHLGKDGHPEGVMYERIAAINARVTAHIVDFLVL